MKKLYIQPIVMELQLGAETLMQGISVGGSAIPGGVDAPKRKIGTLYI